MANIPIMFAHLALQLYDGLPKRLAAEEATDDRSILEAASRMHDVGRSRKEKAHHKVTYKLIERLTPPLSWSKEKMHVAAIVARYHRGALPRTGQKTLVGLSLDQKQTVLYLAGILRLANAFDSQADGHVQRLASPPAKWIPRGRRPRLLSAQSHCRNHRSRPPPARNCLRPTHNDQTAESCQAK